jgi:hypothetical protein
MNSTVLGASYRFFLEARIDIPWAIDITEKVEITVNRIPIGGVQGNI